ncbi:MAG: N-6 DNA methylase [Leptospiraceae bacterium]|nr:N-6 DNA methylase [Leptospiraceae bacterium]
MKDQLESLIFHASASEGLQEFLEEELKENSCRILDKNRGGCYFKAKRDSIIEFSLKTRFTSRISVLLAEFGVRTERDLYESIYSFPWEDLLRTEDTFKIEAESDRILKNSRYVVYKAKDALVDRFRDKTGERPSIEREEPDYLFLLRKRGENVELFLSLSAKSLSHRGYRLSSEGAPIRENMAQALLRFSGWKEGSFMLDPMCGSGTILIEAALLMKTSGYINYKRLSSSKAFLKLFGKVPKTENAAPEKPLFVGIDKNPEIIKLALENAELAGVSDWIEFRVEDFFTVSSPDTIENSYILSNPPYGLRLQVEDIQGFYKRFGEILKQYYRTYTVAIICGDRSLPANMRLKEEKSMKLPISNLKGKMVQYIIL